MLKAYAITYNGRVHRAYETMRGAKIAASHLAFDRGWNEADIAFVELTSGEDADVRLEEIAARTGITRRGSLLAPAIAMQREALNLADLFAAIEAAKQITPVQQKAVNDRLAGLLRSFIAVLLETGIPAQAIINYAGGKL